MERKVHYGDTLGPVISCSPSLSNKDWYRTFPITSDIVELTFQVHFIHMDLGDGGESIRIIEHIIDKEYSHKLMMEVVQLL